MLQLLQFLVHCYDNSYLHNAFFFNDGAKVRFFSYLCKHLTKNVRTTEGENGLAGVYPRGSRDDAGREAQAHHQLEYPLYIGTDIGYGDVLHRCGDGWTLGCEGLGSHRTGGNNVLADGWSGCCGEHGFLRTGGSRHRGKRYGTGPTGAASVDSVLFGVERDHYVAGVVGQRTAALLAWRLGGDSARRVDVFRHDRYGGHLFPDVGFGGVDAEMLGQYEDSVDAEYCDVRAGCGF